MIIYWRVCESEQTQSFTPRWQNKSKLEILKKCWKSIQPGISDKDKIIICWDKVSQETLSWLNTNSLANIEMIECPIPELKQEVKNQLFDVLDKRFHHYTSLAHIIDKYTKQFPNEIHYLCNDDFLHVPHAIDAMRSVYNDGWTGFVLSYDYPDRYTLDKTRQCELLLNQYSHWRTVPSCTGCTSALGTTWQQHIKLFKQNAIFNSDSFTWEMYAKSGALCPVPGMSTHLTEGCMTPRVDWETLYNNIAID